MHLYFMMYAALVSHHNNRKGDWYYYGPSTFYFSLLSPLPSTGHSLLMAGSAASCPEWFNWTGSTKTEMTFLQSRCPSLPHFKSLFIVMQNALAFTLIFQTPLENMIINAFPFLEIIYRAIWESQKLNWPPQGSADLWIPCRVTKNIKREMVWTSFFILQMRRLNPRAAGRFSVSQLACAQPGHKFVVSLVLKADILSPQLYLLFEEGMKGGWRGDTFTSVAAFLWESHNHRR